MTTSTERDHPGVFFSAVRTRSIVVAALLMVSFVLRAYLAAQGGQQFFGDEGRYQAGPRLYLAVLHGDGQGIRQVLGEPVHAMFPVISAGITALQHLLAQFTPYGDWSKGVNVEFTMWVCAIVMAAIYTLDLWLVYRIALQIGADGERAFWVLVLAAGTNAFLYQSRHLLPYGCAMAVFMAGMLAGLGAATARRALLCGLLVGLGHHTYNGYWYLVPTIAAAYWWWWRREPEGARRGVALVGGLAAGLLAPLAVGYACTGEYYWTTMRAFSGSVTQGLFTEGWSLPWEYFWHSEGGLLVVVVIAVLAAWAKRRQLPREARLVLGMLGMSYGLLVLLSVVFERFVVYARTVLPLWLMLLLLGGWALGELVARSRGRGWAVLVGVGVIAALNFRPHFSMVFPREFEVAVLRNYGNPKHTLSVSGSLYIPLALAVSRPELAIVNAQLLYPVRDYIGFPEGRTRLILPHPLTYKPFQYESHTPRERSLLRSHDIRMKLIEVADQSLPDDLPFPLRYQNQDRPSGR